MFRILSVYQPVCLFSYSQQSTNLLGIDILRASPPAAGPPLVDWRFGGWVHSGIAVTCGLFIAVCCLLFIILGQASRPNASVETAKILLFGCRLCPKITPNYAQSEAKLDQNGYKGPWWLPDALGARFGADFGAILGAKMGPCWGHFGFLNGKKLFFGWFDGDQKSTVR